MKVLNYKRCFNIVVIILFSLLISLFYISFVVAEGHGCETECGSNQICDNGYCVEQNPCGDGTCDNARGETKTSCPIDCCGPYPIEGFDYKTRTCKPDCGSAGGNQCRSQAEAYRCYGKPQFPSWDCFVCCLDTNANTCGNNVVDVGEECDGTNLNQQSCTSKGYSGGTLACKPYWNQNKCTFDFSGCTGTLKLTVQKSGSGSGTVTSNPAGINCGSTCDFDFNSGTSVTLTATPAQGSTFSGWSGECTGTSTCSVTMSAARTVTATFNGQGPGDITVPSPTAVPISVAVNEEKTLTIIGGTQPYGIDTPCDGAKADCQLRGTGNNQLYVKGKTAGSTRIIIKDSSSQSKTTGVDITITVSLTGCGARGWRDTPFWGGCGDCPSSCTNGCGEALAYCDGTNWNDNWNPLVPESQRNTATSGHICPCAGSTTGCPPCSNPGTTDVKRRVEKAQTCLPAKPSSMDCLVTIVNGWGSPTIQRHCCKPSGGPRDDTINIPGGRIIDVLIAADADTDTSNGWAWQDVTDGGPGPGGPCALGSYVSLLSGWDLNKLSDCTQQSPKYKAGRVFSYFSPPKITDEVIKKLNEAGLQASQVSGSKDKINFDVEYVPGKKVGIVDVITNVRDDGTGTSWEWLPSSGPIEPPSVSILKYTPDEDASGYCAEDSQCLANPFGSSGTAECINSGEYTEDNYCDNGLWTTRTKLLALKLLKLKSGDYILFCDNKENTLINLQYNIASGELVADIVENSQTNNFCILKTKNSIMTSASMNNKDDLADLFNVLGVSNCNNAKEDGNYYPCDSSNKVWYNKKLNTFIYSSSSVSIAHDIEPSSTLVNIFKAIVETIKKLLTGQLVDDTYLTSIKKFRKLYMLDQESKSIRGTIDGISLRNMAIEYNNIDTQICKFVDYYSEMKKPESSGITCENEGTKYYVLAQGSSGTSLDPDSIWLDMTSKLRLK